MPPSVCGCVLERATFAQGCSAFVCLSGKADW
jgi:hypothetical protein